MIWHDKYRKLISEELFIDPVKIIKSLQCREHWYFSLCGFFFLFFPPWFLLLPWSHSEPQWKFQLRREWQITLHICVDIANNGDSSSDRSLSESTFIALTVECARRNYKTVELLVIFWIFYCCTPTFQRDMLFFFGFPFKICEQLVISYNVRYDYMSLTVDAWKIFCYKYLYL